MEESESAHSSLQAAATRLRETIDSLKQKRLLADANVLPTRPDEAELRKLDSGVKKNTTLVKKLRQVTEDIKAGLLEEIRRTNQTKYVDEAVAACVDSNFKTKDLPAILQVVSLLHQRYAQFGKELSRCLHQAILHNLGPAQEDERDSKASVAKQRSWLRLYTEIQALRIVPEQPEFLTILRKYVALGSSKDRATSHEALTIVAAFAKFAREDFLGYPLPIPDTAEIDPPAESESMAEAQDEVKRLLEVLEAELKLQFRAKEATTSALNQMVKELYESTCASLEMERQSLEGIEISNMKVLNSRGDVTEKMITRLETQRKNLDGLHKLLAALAEPLGLPVPTIKSTSAETLKSQGTVGVIDTTSGKGDAGVFEDEETKRFYTSLPDIRALIPAVLLGKIRSKEADAEQMDKSTETNEASKSDQILHNKEDAATEKQVIADARDEGRGASLEGPEAQNSEDEESAGEEGSGELENGIVEAEETAFEGHQAGAMEAAIRKCLDCTTVEETDEAAIAFCHLNSKGLRKRLVRDLLDGKTGQQHQLPLYARIMAIIHPGFPEMTDQLIAGLERDFKRLMKKKERAMWITDMRLRNCRLLGELTNFKLCPYGTYFLLLKKLLDDFQGPNIDVTAALVETSGRMLSLLPETQERLENMLKIMMKKKDNPKLNLDPRQALAIENAYLAVKPPDKSAQRRSRHPPQRLYMRHLMRNCLTEAELKTVIRKMRLFPWADNETFFVKTMLSSVKGRYSEIPLLASLAAGLAKYRPSLAVALADDLLEEIIWGLENPNSGKYQRRVGHMCLLGELYNYRMLDSKTVFTVLYTLLSFGHATAEESEKLDPPSNYFRVRLVSTVLATCGHYFNKGSAKVKLDRFLVYFQRYLLFKPPLPLDVEFTVQEMLEDLRPGVHRFESYEEASEAVYELEAEDARLQASNEPPAEESESDHDEIDPEGEDNAEHDPETEEASSDGVDIDSDEEEEVRLKQAINPDREVDAEFEAELAAMNLTDSRPQSSRAMGLTANGGHVEETPTMSFKVMLKKSGRESKIRTIQVPTSLGLAVKNQEDLLAAAAEKAEMKRLVLQASEDQEERLESGHQDSLPKSQKPAKASNKAKGRKLEIPIEFSQMGTGRGLRPPAPAAPGRGPPSGRGRGRGRGSDPKLVRGRGRRYSGPSLAPVMEHDE